MIERMIERLTRHVFVRFFISGGTSAMVDLVLLYILNSVVGVHYLLAATLAFIGAFGVSFTLHKYWTFKSHAEETHRQVVMYLFASLLSLVLNTILIYVFVDRFHIQVLLSQIFVGLIIASFSFFLSHKFVFKYKGQISQ